jgi:hypothetical protein
MIALSKALSRATGIDADYYSAQIKTIVTFAASFCSYGCCLRPMG